MKQRTRPTPVTDMAREGDGDYLAAVEDLEASHARLLAACKAVYEDLNHIVSVLGAALDAAEKEMP